MSDTSNLRNQLARRASGTAPVQQDDKPKPLAAVVRDAIDRQAPAFRAILPAHVAPERFARLTLVAIKANPKLVAAFATQQGQTSVLLACMQAAALGLEPNTPTQECWLTPRRSKNPDGTYTDEAELSIGYRGLIKLVRKTDNLKTIFAVVVRKNDRFRWGRGLEADYLEHEPADDGDDDDSITHAYAVARFKDGSYDFLVMNRAQLERRRAMSPSWQADQKWNKKKSPWSNWFAEQCQKTVIRRLTATLDVDPAVHIAEQVDGARLRIGDDGIEAEAIDAGHVAGELGDGRNLDSEGVNPSSGSPVTEADYLEQSKRPDLPEQPEPPTNVDPETGEIDQPQQRWPMSDPQQKKLFAALKTAGIEDRRERLTWAAATLGREIGSFKDLTVTDARTLIDTAEDLLPNTTEGGAS